MKPDNRISSSQAEELLIKQLAVWPLAARNYHALPSAQVKTLTVDNCVVKVQFNPSRISSASAKVDADSLRERKCFLCPDNLPEEQIRLMYGSDYLFLCNPFPIFPEHFTVSTRQHIDQAILPRFRDFLELARRLDAYTLFYNGPRSGASAPDHAHFQVVTRSVMPLDDEWENQLATCGRLLREEGAGQLFLLDRYLRNGFVIKSQTEPDAESLFRMVYKAMDKDTDESEPKMNLFGYHINKTWVLIVIPRRRHRPSYYFLDGADQILTSPGGADIGGLFITAKKEDYEKICPDILRDIYKQVCFSSSDMERIVERMGDNE